MTIHCISYKFRVWSKMNWTCATRFWWRLIVSTRFHENLKMGHRQDALQSKQGCGLEELDLSNNAFQAAGYHHLQHLHRSCHIFHGRFSKVSPSVPRWRWYCSVLVQTWPKPNPPAMWFFSIAARVSWECAAFWGRFSGNHWGDDCRMSKFTFHVGIPAGIMMHFAAGKRLLNIFLSYLIINHGDFPAGYLMNGY